MIISLEPFVPFLVCFLSFIVVRNGWLILRHKKIIIWPGDSIRLYFIRSFFGKDEYERQKFILSNPTTQRRTGFWALIGGIPMFIWSLLWSVITLLFPN